MIEGKTASGFDFHVSEGLAEDAQFLRAVVRMNDSKLRADKRMEAVFDIVGTVFNNEAEEERFYKHLASQNPTGRASVKEVYTEINEIITVCREQDESIKKS